MLQTNRLKKTVGKVISETGWHLRLLSSRNLQKRDLETSFQHLHDCKNINSVLMSESEVEACISNLRLLKLYPRKDRTKNWDAYRAFSFMLRFGNRTSRILDVGSRYGVLLPWLSLYGFTSLHGCDISYEKDFYEGKILYKKQNLESTDFNSNYFDFISSLSVIEHGVDLNRYFFEMHRILKPKGFLLTSTDYWHDPIDTKGLYPYGREFGEMKIFSRSEIEQMIAIANKYDFSLYEAVNFSYQDRVVNWERLNRKFTFIFLVMQKK